MVGVSHTNSARSDGRTSRDNNFDALRLLFSVTVLVVHSFSMTRGAPESARGGLVDHLRRFDLIENVGRPCLIGFFAIGGYLVCNSYLSSRNVLSYIWKRLLRIVPAFLPIALLSVLLVGPIGSDDARAYFRDLDVVDQVRAIATLHVSPRTAHVFPHNLDHLLNGPTWSLPVEFAMYLLLALLGASDLLRRRWPVALCWIALAGLHIFIVRFEPPWAQIARFAQGTMEGAVPLYLVFVGGVLIQLYPALRKSTVVAAAALLWLVARRYGIGHACDYLVAPVIFVWIGENRIRLPRPRDDLSYGIYLNAWPIQQLLIAFVSLDAPMLTALALAICVPLAMLSWRCIERPAMRLKVIDPWQFALKFAKGGLRTEGP